EAVLKGILHDGLDEHAGDKRIESLVFDVFDDLEGVAAEAGHLDVQVVINEGELFAQGDEGLVFAQEAAQDVAQFEDDLAGSVRSVADQGRDGVKGIEEKMWIDLRGKGVHAGLEEELAVTLEVHLDARVVPDFEGGGNGHESGEDVHAEAPVAMG